MSASLTVDGRNPGDAGSDPPLCGPDPTAAVPCGNGVETGRLYPYRLNTRCGIGMAYFDGRLWMLWNPPAASGGKPDVLPYGFGTPSQVGTLRLDKPGVKATFEVKGFGQYEFVPAPAGTTAPTCTP